ncbi:MAG: hypothetical protein WCH11_02460 [Bdellovibrio sp.]
MRIHFLAFENLSWIRKFHFYNCSFFYILSLSWSGFGLGALTTGCVSSRQHPGLQLNAESTYFRLMEKSSTKSQLYDGLMAILDVRATLLRRDLVAAQVDQMARLYQYDSSTYEREKTKRLAEIPKQAQVFVSFFVPDRKHDDLQRSNSKWKIYLDANGKRYEGVAQKMKNVFAEVQALYPEHTRWGTPYLITFPVSTDSLQGVVQLTLTGPVAATSMSFPAEVVAGGSSTPDQR